MANEPRRIPPPVPVRPEQGQFTGQGNSPVLQGFGMVDSRVTIRMRSGAGIGVEYLGESVKLNLDLSTVGEMPPGYDGQYYTVVYDPETGMVWRVEAVAGGVIPPHMHPESDVTNLVADLAARPTDANHDGSIYGRQNGLWVSVGGNVQWVDIAGKPDTFPPTLPIPMSGVEGLDEALDDIAGTIPPPLDAYTKTQSDARYEPVIASGNAAYFWAGDKTWKAVAAGGSTIEVGDAPPTGKPANTMWWESDTGGLFLLYNDGNTTQWVQVNGSRDAYNPIRLNPSTISTNVTIPTGYNGMTAGPITIASGVTVDIASGSTWTVV
jgi:hypothetical protein